MVKIILKNSLLIVGMSIGISSVSEKGQVTIPKEIRDYLGVKTGDKVIFLIEDDKVILVKAGAKRVADVLRRQRPWKVEHVEFQLGLRKEWI